MNSFSKKMVVSLLAVVLLWVPGLFAQTAAALPEMQALGRSDAPYTLGIGDVVAIEVRNQPEFSNSYIVGPDGNIQYAFAGDVKAEGLTKYELKDVLSEKLEKYVRGAEITVSIAAYRSKFVYMMGALRGPGKYPMKGDKVDLREALIASGLPLPSAALRRVYIITPSEK